MSTYARPGSPDPGSNRDFTFAQTYPGYMSFNFACYLRDTEGVRKVGLFDWLFGPNIERLLLDAQYDKIRELASKDKRIVDRLIKLVRHGWQRAYVALGEIGDERAVRPLLEILRDGNVDERSMAAEALGRIGSGQAVDLLIEALEDSSSGVCLAAIVALGKMGDERAAIPLIKKIGYDKLGFYFVPEALVEIGEPAVEPLIEALKDGSPIVCWRAAWALGEIGDRRAVKPLIEVLKEFESGESSRLSGFPASEALWGVYEALGKLGDERGIGQLLKVLKEGYSSGRYWAARALGEMRDARALPELERVAREDEIPSVTKAAKEAIEKIKERMK